MLLLNWVNTATFWTSLSQFPHFYIKNTNETTKQNSTNYLAGLLWRWNEISKAWELPFTDTCVPDAALSALHPFSSVAQSCPTLRPHGLQHPRLLCPSPTPRAYTNSCPSSQWCHPTISSSIIPFSSCVRSFPASGSFPMSQFFASGGQIIGVSASASVFPVNIQDWFPLRWIGWISLQSKRLSRVFSNTTVQKHQFFSAQLYSPTLTSIHDHWKNCWQSNVSAF